MRGGMHKMCHLTVVYDSKEGQTKMSPMGAKQYLTMTPSNCNTKLLNIINTQMSRRWWMSTRAEYEVGTEKWRSMAFISSYISDHMDRRHDDDAGDGQLSGA
eukprot:scaffold10147_cov121-Skeletonema_dohrnii-CCMP3373.AAC.4